MRSPSRFTKLLVLVAAYNEAGTLRQCLERILLTTLPGNLEREIVVVDDGSKDETWDIAQSLAAEHPEVRVFQQPANRGKGAALRRAIAEMRGDVAIFLVPFNPRLTSEFDRQIGHWRRYQKGELEHKMREAGFTVERQFYFNKAGVLAWWLGNTLLGQRTIAAWQLKLYNFLTPLFRLLDRVLPTTGLSTVGIACKPREQVSHAAA